MLIDGFIFFASLVTFVSWFFNDGWLQWSHTPGLSPFTSFSLMLMSGARLADQMWETWSKPMTLAILGIVACGNFSSLWIQLLSPELFLKTIPHTVPTSALTSIGLILFCFYEVLVVIRRSPDSAFIVDDILLHLALFPGGLSLLGHVLGVDLYMRSGVDYRVGIGYFEMLLMGSFAVAAVFSNPNLFMWRFLNKSRLNRLTFALLFINQYVAPLLVGILFRSPQLSTRSIGIEFYVMVAGVLATLIFLLINAFCRNCLDY